MSGTEAVRCANCAHFDNTPTTLERAIPGLLSLGSGFAAVRDQDGLCSHHDRYLPARSRCAEYTPDRDTGSNVAAETS